MSEHRKYHFVFSCGTDNEGKQAIQIGKEVHGKTELIKLLSHALAFPYSSPSPNWDSFSDSMRDLAWIKASEVHIHHSSMPMGAAPRDQRIYLEILNDAIEASLEYRSPVLTVSFNSNLQQNVEALLACHTNDRS